MVLKQYKGSIETLFTNATLDGETLTLTQDDMPFYADVLAKGIDSGKVEGNVHSGVFEYKRIQQATL